MGRGLFFVKVVTVNPIGISLHRDGTIMKMRQQKRGNLSVIMDDVSLSNSRFRIKNLIQVSERQPASIHFDVGFCCHVIYGTGLWDRTLIIRGRYLGVLCLFAGLGKQVVSTCRPGSTL